MHEMALAEGILEVVLDIARESPVKEVRVQAGALHAIVPESLEFSFQLAAQDTPAADAQLRIRKVDAIFQCGQCREVTAQVASPFNCPLCGSSDVTFSAGDELLVEAIELTDGTTIQRPMSADKELIQDHLHEHMVVDGGVMDRSDFPKSG
jgi:hydrogenase nickel incorporation protein HypA/HybF